MALPIPANAAAMQALVGHNDANAAALSITDRYSDQNTLLCLLNRIGCDYRNKFRMLHNGFNTVQSIVDHYGDDIDGFLKQLKNDNKTWSSNQSVMMRSYYTPIVIARLVGILYYANAGINILHQIPDVHAITAADASSYHKLYTNIQSGEEADEPDNVVVPTLSDVKGWMSFKENFLLLLGLTKGARAIPLDYVVDTTRRNATRATATREETDVIDLEEANVLKQGAVHFGDGFKLDNKAVWNKIHTLLLDQPAYNHISQYSTQKNGRAAWIALTTFYEGEDFCQRLRETAFNKLQVTFYRGKTMRFSFEKYVNIHKEAHKMLLDAGFNGGAGLDQESKITYFRNGIKPDAGLEVSISNSRSNPRLSTFDSLVSFFTAEVQHNTMRRSQLKSARDKKISAAGRGNGGGGRGKNKNKSKKGQVPFEHVDGKRVEGRWYSKEEFGKLTPAQRTAVIKLKRKSKSDKGEEDKSVSALRQELRDDMVTLGEAIISGVAHASADNNNATEEEQQPASSDSTINTRQSAESGSIGNIFRSRKRRRGST